jgi:hypothetical protein
MVCRKGSMPTRAPSGSVATSQSGICRAQRAGQGWADRGSGRRQRPGLDCRLRGSSERAGRCRGQRGGWRAADLGAAGSALAHQLPRRAQLLLRLRPGSRSRTRWDWCARQQAARQAVGCGSPSPQPPWDRDIHPARCRATTIRCTVRHTWACHVQAGMQAGAGRQSGQGGWTWRK